MTFGTVLLYSVFWSLDILAAEVRANTWSGSARKAHLQSSPGRPFEEAEDVRHTDGRRHGAARVGVLPEDDGPSGVLRGRDLYGLGVRLQPLVRACRTASKLRQRVRRLQVRAARPGDTSSDPARLRAAAGDHHV